MAAQRGAPETQAVSALLLKTAWPAPSHKPAGSGHLGPLWISLYHHQLGLYRWVRTVCPFQWWFFFTAVHEPQELSECPSVTHFSSFLHALDYFISVLISTLQFGTFRSSVRKGILSTAGHTLSRRLLNRPACRVWTLGCQRWYDLRWRIVGKNKDQTVYTKAVEYQYQLLQWMSINAGNPLIHCFVLLLRSPKRYSKITEERF